MDGSMSRQPSSKDKSVKNIEKTAASDERNILEADDPASLAPDEQVIYFLEKYKWYLLILLVVGSGGFLYQYFGAVISENREAARAEAFFAAIEDQDRLLFAENHRNHPLSGVALFEVGRSQFEEGKYAESADTFRRAARQLGENPIAFRAQLAAGMSLARDGRHAEAFDFLRSASAQPSIPSSVEAEMLFQQAILAHLLERKDAFEELAERVEDHPFGQLWASRLIAVRAAGLGEIVPESELPSPAIEMDLLDDLPQGPTDAIPPGISLPPLDASELGNGDDSLLDPLPSQN